MSGVLREKVFLRKITQINVHIAVINAGLHPKPGIVHGVIKRVFLRKITHINVRNAVINAGLVRRGRLGSVANVVRRFWKKTTPTNVLFAARIDILLGIVHGVVKRVFLRKITQINVRNAVINAELVRRDEKMEMLCGVVSTADLITVRKNPHMNARIATKNGGVRRTTLISLIFH